MMARARSVLLLVVFLASGTSLPSLDALIYHGRGSDLQGGLVHLEPTGPCPSHAAHCTLGRTAPGSGAVGTCVAAARFELAPRSRRELVPAPPGVTTEHSPLGQPRAPPAQLS